jgi:hypothetical protein
VLVAQVPHVNSRPMSDVGLVGLLRLLTVHAAAAPLDNLDFLVAEHFTEVLEPLFAVGNIFRRAVLLGALLSLGQELPETIEVGAVLAQARHINLSAEEVADVASTVKQWINRQ